MLLTIDVGNTQTVFGIYSRDSLKIPGGIEPDAKRTAAQGLTHHFRIATRTDRTPDEHALLLWQLLSMSGIDAENSFSGAVMSSSAPNVTFSLRNMVNRWLKLEPTVVEPGIKTSMPILYDNPKEVGADRIADAVAALDLYGGPAIVVDFGTATTFDAINQKGEYLGGSIAPGIEISLDALYRNAASLKKVELVPPRSVIGRSTTESIQSGALWGFAGQTDAICGLFEEILGKSHIIGTGGLCSVVAPYTKKIEYQEPWLTLHGLRIIYEKNLSTDKFEKKS
ncbi:MAG: type III pantothenate kinase [Acidimicrobiaceae bacterium]|nr:type III pantothenate kinase [Acidimicrobiaceae bacterium]